jgi:hypothetical protein
MKADLDHCIRNILQFTKSHNRHRKAIAQATGESFNIFRVLGVGHLEVKTHSPLLADLLNPKGRHGQGAVFLDIFLAQLGISDFNSNKAYTYTERYIGKVTTTSGGQIDIVVEDGESRILIENKIYAGDQPDQLIRYRNYDHKAHLFYLTLDGRNPDKIDPKIINCVCISYSFNILNWLRECRKEASCLPRVREILSHYITLIEELTHQSTTIQMNKELIEEFISNKENFNAFHTIRDAETAVKIALIEKMKGQIELMLIKHFPSLEFESHNLQERYGSFHFKSPILTEKNIKICFMFDRVDLKNMMYGFAKYDPVKPCLEEQHLREEMRKQNLKLQNSTEWWPAYVWFENPYFNWGNEAFEGIITEDFTKNLKNKLEILVSIADAVFA